MAEPPTTPPRTRHSGNLPPHPQTPEQIRRTEEARLRAKASRAAHDAARLSSGAAAAAAAPGGAQATSALKRTHAQMSSSSTPAPKNVRDGTTMTAPAADAALLRPAHKFATHQFIEYDLSRMTDTKGGFLSAQDDPHNRALHESKQQRKDGEEKPRGMTAEEWERVQLLRKLRANKHGPFEPGLSVLVDEKARAERSCRECGSLEIDFKWLDAFACGICKGCREKYPEKYSLLTKTEAREDYLLTNPELNDEDILKHLKKTNPHSATWNDMQLYLRYQVEAYAFSPRKWGSAESLDREFERRAQDKKQRKELKFKAKLEELKKRTRTDAYRRSNALVEKGSRVRAGLSGEEVLGEARFGMRLARGDKHVHDWGRPVMDEESGLEVKRCVECGAECEEFEL